MFAGVDSLSPLVEGNWRCDITSRLPTRHPRDLLLSTAAVDRSDRSRDRSIESIDSIIFRSFEIFGNCSWRWCDSNGSKIVQIRAILEIFGRLKIFTIFDSIDSIFRSIRSILRLTAVVDRPAKTRRCVLPKEKQLADFFSAKEHWDAKGIFAEKVQGRID